LDGNRGRRNDVKEGGAKSCKRRISFEDEPSATTPPTPPTPQKHLQHQLQQLQHQFYCQQQLQQEDLLDDVLTVDHQARDVFLDISDKDFFHYGWQSSEDDDVDDDVGDGGGGGSGGGRTRGGMDRKIFGSGRRMMEKAKDLQIALQHQHQHPQQQHLQHQHPQQQQQQHQQQQQQQQQQQKHSLPQDCQSLPQERPSSPAPVSSIPEETPILFYDSLLDHKECSILIQYIRAQELELLSTQTPDFQFEIKETQLIQLLTLEKFIQLQKNFNGKINKIKFRRVLATGQCIGFHLDYATKTKNFGNFLC